MGMFDWDDEDCPTSGPIDFIRKSPLRDRRLYGEPPVIKWCQVQDKECTHACTREYAWCQSDDKTKADCKAKFNNFANSVYPETHNRAIIDIDTSNPCGHLMAPKCRWEADKCTCGIYSKEKQTMPTKIIGIAGRKGHGKDTAAKALPDYENVKFAGALKAMIRTYMEYVGMDAATIDRCIDGDMKEVPLEIWGGKTTRYAMQTIGTEWGRNIIWEDLWVDSFKRRAVQFDQVVNTDPRFPNEVATIKEMGGTTARVVDPRKPPSTDEHPSETGIDTLDVDCVIVNDGTIEDLHNKVKRIFLSTSNVESCQKTCKSGSSSRRCYSILHRDN